MQEQNPMRIQRNGHILVHGKVKTSACCFHLNKPLWHTILRILIQDSGHTHAWAPWHGGRTVRWCPMEFWRNEVIELLYQKRSQITLATSSVAMTLLIFGGFNLTPQQKNWAQFFVTARVGRLLSVFALVFCFSFLGSGRVRHFHKSPSHICN